MYSPDENQHNVSLKRSYFILLALAIGLGMALLFAAQPLVVRAANTLAISPNSNQSQLVANFSNSYKTASQKTLSVGETLTYTIHLYNGGQNPTTADVSDPVPAELEYVDGSASGGGAYDAASKTVTWSGVEVPANTGMDLMFEVTTNNDVSSPTPVTNKATISISGTPFERQTTIWLVPSNVEPVMFLGGSRKLASQHMLAPGEQVTFTINLHNSGTVSATASVTDPLPAELNFVSGTVTGGGSYDDASRTVSWANVDVPAGSDVPLSFAATPGVTITLPTPVTNVATISSGGNQFERKAKVILVPQPVGNEDNIPPVVHSLTIDDSDVTTSPTVTLHISATDNVGVKWMYLREWYLSTSPMPHWVMTNSSGWVPFQADYPWSLIDGSGTHFVGVWVADGANNHSHISRNALDFTSLLLPDTNISPRGLVPYLVYYDAGVDVSAVVTPTTGNAELYVWYPGNFRMPNQVSAQPGTATETVSFTTPEAGIYIFLVRATTPTTYNMTITPAGGPRAWSIASAQAGSSLVTSGQAAPTNPDSLVTEPIFSQAGLDPLSIAAPPSGPNVIYLPVIVRK